MHKLKAATFMIYTKMKAIKKISNQKGFTLIELLVAVAIIALLAAAAVFGYVKYIQYARRAVNEANAKSLADALTAEGVTPADCSDEATALNNPLTYMGGSEFSSLNMPIVLCANKLIDKSKTINPFTNAIYSKLNNTCNTPMVGNVTYAFNSSIQKLIPNPSYPDYTIPVMKSSGQQRPEYGIYEGDDATQIITGGWGGSCLGSGPVLCSDQLDGNRVLDESGAPLDSNLNYGGSSGAGLMIVEVKDTGKFGVATCDPYVGSGVIGKIFTINNNLKIRP
jgi:prepilin-type N-terminal cleavage/methylation domain-containing protein